MLEGFNMKKNRISFLLIFIMAISFILLFGHKTSAYTEKTQFVNTKANVWYQSKVSEYDWEKDIRKYYVYKITAPSHGYITLSVPKTASRIEVYDHYETTEKNTFIDYHWRDDTTAIQFAVDKGTYYVRDVREAGSFKYTFTPNNPQKNYSLKKAKKLNANKTVTDCLSRNNYYCRWYKIRLSKKKRITFWSNNGEYVRIYNSKFKRVDTEQAGTNSTKYITKKQKKGTYYIRIVAYRYYDYPRYPVVTLKWS